MTDMYGLPTPTEVRRPLPKAQLYRKFGLKQRQRDAFDADVARMDFVNLVAPSSLPAIPEGNEVKAVFVIDVELKRPDYDTGNIALIAKLIPQRIIFALRHGGKVRFAVYHTKLFTSRWQDADSAVIALSGLDLDAAWQNMVTAIAGMEIAEGNSLTEQIRIDERRGKTLRLIASLERKMAVTKQPRRKRELFEQLKKQKSLLDPDDGHMDIPEADADDEIPDA